MNQWKSTDLLAIALMMFSIFFGAGNLIFPPALGQAAGQNVVPAMAGFLLTGVGLPLMGIVAIALQGGKYTDFISEKVHPRFAVGLLSILYLTIGPLFAVPRTGAVSFEIGIHPFLSEEQVTLVQAIYTACFFLCTYYLALNPSKIVDRVGKFLTPVLLFFLMVLFAKTFFSPLGDILPATGTYVDEPFAQGFQDGYLTMDLLASLAVGSLVVNAIRMRGIDNNWQAGKICIKGGCIAVTLMAMVYASLAYLGATSASVLGHSPNGGALLASAAGIFFGSTGNLILAFIIGFACLTTSCGMVSACSWFFNTVTKNRIAYQRVVLWSCLFSFITSNVGLTELIKFSVPFLVAIYPVVIVLVLTSLFARFIGERKAIYRCAIIFTMPFCIIDGLNAAGIDISTLNSLLSHHIPFYSLMLGWLVPALAGAVLGGILSLRKKAA